MHEKIVETIEIIRKRLLSDPSSIIYTKMGNTNNKISYSNQNISNYYEFLKVCDGARFGGIDLWSKEELESNQYRTIGLDSNGEKWMEIGQILYEPLVINIDDGSMMCYSQYNANDIIYEFENFEIFLEKYVFGEMYNSIIPDYQDDEWHIFLQGLE